MYKIIEQNGQVSYGVTTYAVDSFEDLPKKANLGDKAIFNNNGSLNIGVYFSEGWIVSQTSTGGTNNTPSQEDIMDTMAEMGLVTPVMNEEAILISNNNEIYSL